MKNQEELPVGEPYASRTQNVSDWSKYWSA